MKKYIPLHGHSTYSFLEAIGKIDQILDTAKVQQLEAVTITDYHGLYGVIEFFQKSQKYEIKPIVGLETFFVPQISQFTSLEQAGYIVLIAKNYDGYQNLLKLTTKAWFNVVYGKGEFPKLSYEELKEINGNIYVLLGSLNSYFYKLIVNKEFEKIEENLNRFIEIFGKENVLIAVNIRNKIDEISKVNDFLIQIAKKYKLKLVVDNNFHYPTKEDKEVWKVGLAIREQKLLSEIKLPKGDFYIMSGEEIFDYMKSQGFEEKNIIEWMENNYEIGSKIGFEIQLGQLLFPKYENPENIKELYEKYKNDLIVSV